MVPHFLTEELAETACELYHNFPTRLHIGTGIVFLYARFVLNIFKSVKNVIPQNWKDVLSQPTQKRPDESTRPRPDENSHKRKSSRSRSSSQMGRSESASEEGSSNNIKAKREATYQRLTTSINHKIDGRTKLEWFPDYFKAQYPELGELLSNSVSKSLMAWETDFTT